MTRRRLLILITAAMGLIWIAAYLHDPPWAGGMTSGMRDWEEDPPGTRWRWTSGYGSFFVPSDADGIVLPMRGVFAGAVHVDVSVDGRWLATVALTDPNAWTTTRLPMPHRRSTRRFRRIDLSVSRVMQPYNLGVQVGEVAIERAGRSP
jgi:hypothetical protein